MVHLPGAGRDGVRAGAETAGVAEGSVGPGGEDTVALVCLALSGRVDEEHVELIVGVVAQRDVDVECLRRRRHVHLVVGGGGLVGLATPGTLGAGQRRRERRPAARHQGAQRDRGGLGRLAGGGQDERAGDVARRRRGRDRERHRAGRAGGQDEDARGDRAERHVVRHRGFELHRTDPSTDRAAPADHVGGPGAGQRVADLDAVVVGGAVLPRGGVGQSPARVDQRDVGCGEARAEWLVPRPRYRLPCQMTEVSRRSAPAGTVKVIFA